MEITAEIYIPYKFCDRTQKEIDSFSEKLGKIIIAKILKIDDSDIKRGNDNKKEPDYIYNGQGYEITLSAEKDFFQQIKGKIELNNNISNVREDLEKVILYSIQQKANKHYCVPTTLLLFCFKPYIFWDIDMGQQEKFTADNDYDALTTNLAINLYNNSRSSFNDIYNKYIKENIFTDIYIVNLSFDERLVIYSLKNYNEHKVYRFYIGTNKKRTMPYCRIISIIEDDKIDLFYPPKFIFKYKIIYG